ncbi:hypothetical protein A9K55_001227 [Cordyceps militaris]|uniref:Uncharacterized protein n=1 Tax=Cordyceps militaris TaxID=73501 RepID=A0A2H4SS12_CORMI|nr:hypothetical protein A9K55_001227 [Cordyceps militaris]
MMASKNSVSARQLVVLLLLDIGLLCHSAQCAPVHSMAERARISSTSATPLTGVPALLFYTKNDLSGFSDEDVLGARK